MSVPVKEGNKIELSFGANYAGRFFSDSHICYCLNLWFYIFRITDGVVRGDCITFQGPIPDNFKMFGEPMAPADRITSY